MSKPTILLTGANGFLGSHLLEALISQGNKVVILKRNNSDLCRIKHLAGRFKSYNVDNQPLVQAFQEQQIDCVVHLSTLYKKYEDVEDIEQMVESNITFPSLILDIAVKFGVKSFINTGTFFEMDCSKLPVCESAPTSAFNFYARTKIAFEAILKTYDKFIAINTLKLFSPFGEKDNNKLIPYMMKNMIKGTEISLSEGFQKIDLIYVQDIIFAYLKVITRFEKNNYKPEYETFNIGSGSALSIRQIHSLLEKIAEKKLKVKWGEKSKSDIPIVYADNTKANEILDWRPTIGVEKGLKNTLNYFEEIL